MVERTARAADYVWFGAVERKYEKRNEQKRSSD